MVVNVLFSCLKLNKTLQDVIRNCLKVTKRKRKNFPQAGLELAQYPVSDPVSGEF